MRFLLSALPAQGRKKRKENDVMRGTRSVLLSGWRQKKKCYWSSVSGAAEKKRHVLELFSATSDGIMKWYMKRSVRRQRRQKQQAYVQ